MNDQERELDMMVAELEQENRLLRARNDRLLAEQHLQALHDENVRLGLYEPDNTSKMYEELRSIIDGGSESFTHDDAVQYLQEALTQPEQNLNCKSVQARLATAWGYVKAEQKLVGTVGELFDERVISKRELDRDSLVYIAQPKENT